MVNEIGYEIVPLGKYWFINHREKKSKNKLLLI